MIKVWDQPTGSHKELVKTLKAAGTKVTENSVSPVSFCPVLARVMFPAPVVDRKWHLAWSLAASRFVWFRDGSADLGL